MKLLLATSASLATKQTREITATAKMNENFLILTKGPGVEDRSFVVVC
jgi:hypothetical protein